MDVRTPVGERWHKEIEKELHAARAVVVLWSARSRDSDFVLEEAEYGRRNEILFPAFIERVEFPYGFGRIQTAELVGWAGDADHPGLAELLQSLKEHLNSREPTPEPGVPQAEPVVTSNPVQPVPARNRNDLQVVPADLNYAVVVAIVTATVGTIQQIQEMSVIGVPLAVAFTGAIYGLVYRNLDGDIATARNSALVCAIVFGFFLFVSVQRGHMLFLALNVIAVVCLSYAFVRLTGLKSVSRHIGNSGPPLAVPSTIGSPAKAVEIFISSRRDDSSDVTGRVYDRLLQEFGRSKVFKDVDSIPAGADFQANTSDTLTRCNACLVVIGARWLHVCDEHGQPRIKDPSDHVRLEIETALQRGIRVIPVLVQGAPMPSRGSLPSSLQGLVLRNALPVRPDPDFHRDMDRLCAAIKA